MEGKKKSNKKKQERRKQTQVRARTECEETKIERGVLGERKNCWKNICEKRSIKDRG